jgi:phosphomevalonate kinase
VAGDLRGRRCGYAGAVRVVAISGRRYAGKDTLAGAITTVAAERGVGIAVHAFAAESKRMFAAQQRARGVAVEEERLLADRAYKELWRPRLTEFTVAALRADPLVFCRAVAGRIAAGGCAAVVSDLRLRVEVELLRGLFELVVVRVTRPDALRAASGWRYTPTVDEHPTETEFDDPRLWDEEIVNCGSIAEIEAVVGERFSGWFG